MRRLRAVALALLLAGALAAPAPASATTTYRVAVVLINHTNNAIQPFTPASAATSVFTGNTKFDKSAAAFYAESSFGQVAITGQVFGWWTVPYPKAPCDTLAWKNAARAIALAQGVNLDTDFDHVALVWPRTTACQFSARAGSFYNVSGSKLKYQDVVHEFGHSLSLNHANGRWCTDGGVKVPLSETCTTQEYGDYFDSMGNQSGHWFSTWARTRLGWLDNTQVVSASGQYTLGSAQLATSANPQLLMVPRADGTWFALEYRRHYGVYEQWQGVYSPAAIDGVFVRIATELPDIGSQNAETVLLDMTPTMPESIHNVVLPVGGTFTYEGVTISTVSIGPASTVISVTVP